MDGPRVSAFPARTGHSPMKHLKLLLLSGLLLPLAALAQNVGGQGRGDAMDGATFTPDAARTGGGAGRGDGAGSSPVIATGTIADLYYLDGMAVSVPFIATPSFPAGTVFTAQLSDATGGFLNPVAIGTVVASNGGTIAATIPMQTPAGLRYRIRVISDQPLPGGFSTDNGANLRVNGPATTGGPGRGDAMDGATFTPDVARTGGGPGRGDGAGSSPAIITGALPLVNYLDGMAVAVTFTATPSFPAGTVFTAQLSNASGSFNTPVAIGTLTATSGGTIAATIPNPTPHGVRYRIRVISDQPLPGGFSTDNGADLTVNGPATTGGPGRGDAMLASASITTGTIAQLNYVDGMAVSVPYTTTGSFPAGTVFTAQLSNASGSFANPVAIGTLAATGGGTITATIPTPTPHGVRYRIRVVSDLPLPGVSGTDNGVNLTVNGPATTGGVGRGDAMVAGATITTGAIAQLNYLDGMAVSVPFTTTGTYAAGNVFTAQLSNASGSFTNPVVLGTLAATAGGTITGTIPVGTPPGQGYRIRVVSDQPIVLGSRNTVDLVVNWVATIGGDGRGDAMLGFTATGLNTITTGTIAQLSYLDGMAVSVPYTITGTYAAGNVFTAQLSDATGGFANPLVLGTLAATTSGTIAGTIPAGTPAGQAYRIRVVSDQPAVLGTDNGVNVFVNWPASTGGDGRGDALLSVSRPPVIQTLAIAGAPFCGGSAVSVGYTVSGSLAVDNVFTAQLSDAVGSFAAPVAIGTLSANANGTITATLPPGTPGGSGYRIRVQCSDASAFLLDNGTNLTIQSQPTAADAGTDQARCVGQGGALLAANTPTVGNGAWSVVSGPSTSTAQFSSLSSPSATFTPAGGVGEYTLRWSISNGVCTPSTDDVVVTVNALPTVNAGSYGPVCIDAGLITLDGTPSGGTWSGTGVTDSTFDPSAGTQAVTYTFTDANGCSNSASTTITVNDLPVVSTGSYGPVCLDAADITLVGSPVGGTWSGVGVSGNSFDPGVGTQGVTYTFTNANGCSNSASTTITVNDLPVVSPGSYGPVCIDAADVILLGSPAGGTWSGVGVSGNVNDGFVFDPGVQTQTLTYSTSNANGCSGSASVTITVNELPEVSGDSYGAVCTDAADIVLTGTPAGGTWSGNGVSGDANDGFVFDPDAGTQTLFYTYTDANGCSNTALATITVYDLPVISAGSYGAVCADAPDVSLGGTPAGGNWSGTGVSGNVNDGFVFDPSVGTRTVTYTYTNVYGCTNNASAIITVNDLPDVTCPGNLTACSNDAPFALMGGSPGGGTFTGSGVSDGVFAPAIAGVGVHSITYTYTEGNSCSSSCSFSITVSQAVDLYTDADGDGFGDVGAVPVQGCAPQPGYATNNSDDCDDDALKTTPGACGCGVPDTDTDGDGTADCNDGCPNDPAKVSPGTCGCGTPDTDTDVDTYADCVDSCPNDPLKIAPGACGCGNPDVDSDGDGALNCNDACPNDPGKITSAGSCGCGNPEPGTACNDGNTSTENDVVNASCQCVGTPVANALTMAITTDGNGGTSWEIRPLGGGDALCSGAGYAPSSSTSNACSLPDGCYELRVFDTGGDGMCCINGLGGYVLRTVDDRRIIDAHQQGIFGSTAVVASGLGFCVPLGTDRLTSSRCDREDYLPSDFIQAVPNNAVGAQFNVGAQSDDGYQFWFFNPNGGYTRRILITHATNNYWFPTGADRCSYLKLDQLMTNPLPLNTLLNVRVRSMVNGVYSAFGPACRFKIDLSTNCPITQLVSTPGPQLSCGRTGVMLNGSTTLYAVPVASANRYQFEFSRTGYLRKITSPGSSLNLTMWATLPLQYNRTYNVRVRASFDNGVSYCPFGPACTISTFSGGNTMVLQGGATELDERRLQLWPNPSNGDAVSLSIADIAAGVSTVQVDLFDLTGKRVLARQLPLQDGRLYSVLSLGDEVASGIYMVNVTAGDFTTTERLVIQR